jgi:tetratricopeptide (TPR) repeat protein
MATLQNKLNKALVLHRKGSLGEAERLYIEILAQQPNHFDALHLLGLIAIQRQQLNRGIHLIAMAIKQNAMEAAAHSNLANALMFVDRPNEALASYDRAIKLNPRFGEAHNNRGNALLVLKRMEEALHSFDKAIALAPSYAEAHNNRGNALLALQRGDEALASFDKAITLIPSYAEAHNNRGNALLALQRGDEALASIDKAISLRPSYADAYFNRGNTLAALDHPGDALTSCEQAIALKPNYAEVYNVRGNVLVTLRRFQEALGSYEQAIALKPDYADAYWNQSLCFLLTGNYQEGWRQYEWRKKLSKPIAVRPYPQPLWLGDKEVAGKTLLIYSEQGLGDTIQFCRYVRLISDLGARVILEVPQTLKSILANLPETQVVGTGGALMPFDYQCPLMSLPLAFKTTLSNIPATIPYLRADVEKSKRWKLRLGERSKLRVGLVWSGGFRPNQPELWAVNRRRNIPLITLESLEHPDIEFYSLQKGDAAEAELLQMKHQGWRGPAMINFTDDLHDFSDTAALIDNLDLVISVDTSTAHLTGALGKPVWILNRFDCCWRWLIDRSDSPWYPTAKLYRQHKPGHWDDVIAQVKADLAHFRPR